MVPSSKHSVVSDTHRAELRRRTVVMTRSRGRDGRLRFEKGNTRPTVGTVSWPVKLGSEPLPHDGYCGSFACVSLRLHRKQRSGTLRGSFAAPPVYGATKAHG